MCKICYDLCDVKFSDFIDSLQTWYNLRCHTLTVKCTKSPKLNSYLQFFYIRILSVWNSLPESIVCANTLPAFKSRLKKLDLHRYCQPDFLKLTVYCVFDFVCLLFAFNFFVFVFLFCFSFECKLKCCFV